MEKESNSQYQSSTSTAIFEHMLQSDESIHDLYNRIDVNHDNCLDREEVVNYFRVLGIPVTDAGILFESLGKYKNDTVSYDEFHAYIMKREEQLLKTFHAIDTDGNGSIDFDELKHWLSQDKNAAYEEKFIQDFISLLDTDHSGAISFPEFRNYVGLFPDFIQQSKLFDHWVENRHLSIEGESYHPDPSENEGLLYKPLGPMNLLLAGGVAGAISRSVTAPLDRVKTMLQAGPPPGHPEKGLLQVCRDVVKESGIRAFWKGNGTNVMKIIPESAIKFYSFETLQGIIANDVSCVQPLERFVAGSLAGVCAQSSIYPMEVAKTRLALSSGEYTGLGHCLYSVFRNEGPKALYKGLLPSIVGIIPYAGIDLAVYSMLKEKYQQKYPGNKPSSVLLLGCGALSSSIGAFVAYPFVTVRTRLQAQGMKGRPVVFNGVSDCVRKIWKTEGYSGFYRGLVPNFMKVIPAISLSYLVYEKMKDLLRNNSL